MVASWAEIGGITGAILIPLLGGTVGFLCIPKPDAIDWYESLKKPSWTAPNWLVGLGWLVTCILIGLASYWVWRDGNGFQGEAKIPLIAYITVLVFNFAWTPLFFNGQSTFLGFWEIVIYLIAIVWCTVAFWQINHMAGIFMLILFLWEFYTGSFLLFIWLDNRNTGDTAGGGAGPEREYQVI